MQNMQNIAIGRCYLKTLTVRSKSRLLQQKPKPQIFQNRQIQDSHQKQPFCSLNIY